ncbi:nitroreductase [Stella humosa]|uniref:Nitroreductase n=1 Tax=Stella humosa TaxID=94 RepID=A0A3N1KSI4_9PROT|nr:nitroreductase [Stella humosa]ROP81076.1 nitroreductase [Stella humosa]BBK29766.1 nitroreductase [Stella humosa]
MPDSAAPPPVSRQEILDHHARGNPVLDAIAGRTSVRAFLPTPVDRETIERILAVASRAASGSNTQPWKVYVVTGAARDRLTADVLHAHNHEEADHVREYEYYMVNWRDPYLARRRKVGWGLYGILGIGRADKAEMHAQRGRNYLFFDAPVGIILTIERDLEQGSWVDLGIFLSNLMTAARGLGLETCAQAAFANFHKVLRRHLPIPDQEMVVCGIALGHADPDAIVNRLETEREPVSAFARFVE